MEHKDYLWYIIPGSLLLFPLTIFNEVESFIPFLNNNKIISFLILSFTVGYILQILYRVIYIRTIHKKRPLIEFLKHKLEILELGDKYIEEISEEEIDYLYGHFIYYNEKYEYKVKEIRSQSQYLSACLVSLLGTLFGLVIMLIGWILSGINLDETFLLILLTYTILIGLFSYKYSLYSKRKESNERVLVTEVFRKFEKEEIKPKTEEVKNILADLRWKSNCNKQDKQNNQHNQSIHHTHSKNSR